MTSLSITPELWKKGWNLKVKSSWENIKASFVFNTYDLFHFFVSFYNKTMDI